jgi:hypothetical protein
MPNAVALPAAPTLAELREDAARRNVALDRGASFTVRELAERWKLGETTVRDIPRDELPYMSFGRGLVHRRRRYRRADVERYEQTLLGEGAA